MLDRLDFEWEDASANPPDLDAYYGNLHNYVRMVCDGYSNLLMLDAKGGLGKTHNVRTVLAEERESSGYVHQKGFTTPIELFKTLWKARHDETVLFLDDMSGVTGNQKAIDMLKSATDTEGDENWVEYRTSQDIEHPTVPNATLPNTFCFNGTVIMSFNETPDNRHFKALRDRGTYYQLSFTYDERLDLIREIAKLDDFSGLPVWQQQQTAEWIAEITNPAFEVTIRTFEEVCQMRRFGQDNDENWEKMALEVFDIDYPKYVIIELRKNADMSVEEQVDVFNDKTGYSQSTYYDMLSEIRDERKA
jgi:hypothetical protein